MARPRRRVTRLVRCPCGLYQAAPMWRAKGCWWLHCLVCGPVAWRVSAEHHATSRPLSRLPRAA